MTEPPPRDPLSIPRVRLEEPGDLIASLPAMFRFVPNQSLVLMVLAHAPNGSASNVMDWAVRLDLYPADWTTAEINDAVARVQARPNISGVLAVVVDDSFDPDGPTPHEPPLLVAITQKLAAEQIRIHQTWIVSQIQAGRRWRTLIGPAGTGSVNDPQSSMMAVRRVMAGQPILRDRTELTSQVTPDPILHEQLDQHLDQLATPHPRPDLPAHQQRSTQLRYVYDLITTLRPGTPVDMDALACTTLAMRDTLVRNAICALARTAYSDAAEDLFAQLTRATTGHDRAAAAAVFGALAYMRGDGPLAGIALNAALDADPHNSLALQLHAALETSTASDHIAELRYTSRDAAADLGVTVPGTE
ncbi:DUF4192 domain-containing protein [Nocardia carnea]|uniref:DUF4192 domain-containing protein n=1 Tax=Nocardia carnea TaxID=37328 RepID=UPI002453A91A|nr:DUF4192 domain-containing protein [Nocardia carnea]